MTPADDADDRVRLRTELRTRRNSLDDQARRAASEAVCRSLLVLPEVTSAHRLAGYRAVRGEIDVDAVLQARRRSGAQVTVPRVSGDMLDFVVWSPEAAARPGSFGISEPVGGPTVPFADHAVVLVPLVAFDQHGNRLGQGGGFYDRAIAAAPKRPFLVGVAHGFQEVAEVPVRAWDQRLDLVVTDRAVHRFTVDEA